LHKDHVSFTIIYKALSDILIIFFHKLYSYL